MTRLSLIVPTRCIDPGILYRARCNAARAGADELILVEPDDLPEPPPGTAADAGWRCLRAPRGRVLIAGANFSREHGIGLCHFGTGSFEEPRWQGLGGLLLLPFVSEASASAPGGPAGTRGPG